MNKGKQLILGILVAICTLMIVGLASTALASAQQQESLGSFDQYSCVNIKQICANCTYVNITSITSPINNSQVLGQVEMTQDGTEYSYEFCDTSALGQYIVNWKANPDGITTIGNFDFQIDSGSALLFLIIMGVAIVTLMIGFFAGNWFFGFISGVMFLFAGIYIMIYGVLNLADLYTQSVAIVLIGIGIILTASAGYEIIADKE